MIARNEIAYEHKPIVNPCPDNGVCSDLELSIRKDVSSPYVLLRLFPIISPHWSRDQGLALFEIYNAL